MFSLPAAHDDMKGFKGHGEISEIPAVVGHASTQRLWNCHADLWALSPLNTVIWCVHKINMKQCYARRGLTLLKNPAEFSGHELISHGHKRQWLRVSWSQSTLQILNLRKTDVLSFVLRAKDRQDHPDCYQQKGQGWVAAPLMGKNIWIVKRQMLPSRWRLCPGGLFRQDIAVHLFCKFYGAVASWTERFLERPRSASCRKRSLRHEGENQTTITADWNRSWHLFLFGNSQRWFIFQICKNKRQFSAEMWNGAPRKCGFL